MLVYIREFVNLIEDKAQKDYFQTEFLIDCNNRNICEAEYITWLTEDLARYINLFLQMVVITSDDFCNHIFCRIETPLVLGYVDKKMCFNFNGEIFQLRYI